MSVLVLTQTPILLAKTRTYHSHSLKIYWLYLMNAAASRMHDVQKILRLASRIFEECTLKINSHRFSYLAFGECVCIYLRNLLLLMCIRARQHRNFCVLAFQPNLSMAPLLEWWELPVLFRWTFVKQDYRIREILELKSTTETCKSTFSVNNCFLIDGIFSSH